MLILLVLVTSLLLDLAGALPDKVSTVNFTTREGGKARVFELSAGAGVEEWNVMHQVMSHLHKCVGNLVNYRKG